MKTYTHEEIKAMVGTEFKYVFSDRSEIKAMVAAFDPEIGFTCLATSLIDSSGRDWSDDVDENGNVCLLGYHRSDLDDGGLAEISFILRSIKHLGYYVIHSDTGFGDSYKNGGDASCAF
jgi:hypothetical protein